MPLPRMITGNKRLQVAYTHAHAYMSALVPQGSQWYFGVLYIPDVTIGYVTRVVAECAVMNQSRCLQPGPGCSKAG